MNQPFPAGPGRAAATRVEARSGSARGAAAVLNYLLLVGLPVGALIAVLVLGARSGVSPAALAENAPAVAAKPVPFSLLRLLGQVVLLARLVGRVFRKIGQPQVVGEMAAGLLLGPSVLGAAWPGAYATLFPAGSLDAVQALSQMGLLVFMFLVGLEIDLSLLRGKGRAAMTISHASIALPFALGAGLALWLYPQVGVAGVGFVGFALFLGTAMSITAFPVLARILTERHLLGTEVGAVTLACAAVDDITAWAILACVVLLVRESSVGVPLWVTLGGTVTFLLVMVYGVAPLLRRAYARGPEGSALTHDRLATVLVVVLLSAIATEALGIHALFGAFLAGVVMPREAHFGHGLAERLEAVTVVLLLPLFFAFTGLRTRIDLLGGRRSWAIFLAVLAVAVLGKLGGSTIAARVTGMRWRQAASLGTLMNTRGLMELVVLNLGLEIGVISPRLFAVMVLMALVTTFMTTPLLALLRTSTPGGLEAAPAGPSRGAGALPGS